MKEKFEPTYNKKEKQPAEEKKYEADISGNLKTEEEIKEEKEKAKQDPDWWREQK